MRFVRRICGLTALLGTLVSPSFANDWPFWRGPEQSGLSREPAPVTTWKLDGENQLWRSPIGGRTTPIVLNGRVYLIGPDGDGVTLHERIVCLNADTGDKVWEHAFNVFHTDIVENRVGWTSLCADPETGNIYAHATGGEFFCFNRDGKILWKHSLTEEFGRISGYGGRLHNPVVDEDRVIISFTCSSWGDFSKPAHRYYAFDKNTGAVIWSAAPGDPPNDTSCGSPTIAVIGGRRLLLAPNVDGALYAMNARTGESVWKFKLSARPLNTTPAVDGNLIYLNHSEENIDTTVMGRVVCINGDGVGDITGTHEVWRADGLDAGYASPAISNGRVYIVDNGARLYALDAKTGQQYWRQPLGTVARGSPVATADGVIYVGEVNGVFHILKDAGDTCETLCTVQLPKRGEAIDEVQSTPAVANGRVYFQSRYSTFCLGQKNADPTRFTVAIPNTPPENAPAGRPAALIPAEITLQPGESVNFGEHPFPGPVTISAAGVAGQIQGMTFTAAADALFSAGVIKAKSGDQEVAARVRICPKPPFKVDFEDMPVDSAPPGWLNVNSKAKVVERDGSKVLQKLAERPSPPFMRIRTFMTPPIAGSQSIRADMMGTFKKPHWKPDMGLVACRYEMMLMGDEPDNPRIRIVSWAPIPRLQHEVPFDWKPDTWYTMLLSVEQRENDAVIRGKVWPRGESEPDAWNIEVVDPFPNREGSPALYAYSAGTTAKSKGTEVFFDNVEVMGE
jgi:outer membrane protein assembly factor BamB